MSEPARIPDEHVLTEDEQRALFRWQRFMALGISYKLAIEWAPLPASAVDISFAEKLILERKCPVREAELILAPLEET